MCVATALCRSLAAPASQPACLPACLQLSSEPLVSGVYTLLSEGALSPDHPDHPASRRRPGEAATSDFRGVTLDTAGLRLGSSYMLAHERWGPEPRAGGGCWCSEGRVSCTRTCVHACAGG